MKREEAVSLIKELLIVCETMHYAPVVSLRLNDNKPGSWAVRVKWVSNNEKGCFDKVVQERGLIVTETTDGYTIFQKP
jgi:hypothetical protein